MLSTNKLRNVYRRHNVLHTCFNGFLIGPASESAIVPGTQVRVKPIETAEAGLVFEVFMPIPSRKGVRETWVALTVPGDHREPTPDRQARIVELPEVV